MNIEKEVQARVDFKMNELLTVVKNTASHNWNKAFKTGHPKYVYYWGAFNQMLEMFKKELEMELPFSEISELIRKKKKDIAVNKIMEIFCEQGKSQSIEWIRKRKELAVIIEECQKW